MTPNQRHKISCCKSVIARLKPIKAEKRKTSSFRNHLFKCALAIDRKFSHSLRVYYRSELSLQRSAETRKTPRWASTLPRAGRKVNCLCLQESDQSACVGVSQATSHTYDNAGGPVPFLTIHNPSLASSVTSSVAGPCSLYPRLFITSDKQLFDLYHTTRPCCFF